jgi:hypothetical protein
MRSCLALAVVATAACQFEPATAQTWYWCDSARAYYPYVATCPEQWRVVSPALTLPRPDMAAPQAQDACSRPEIRSQGAISWLNSKVGFRDGPSARIIAIEAPITAVGDQRNYYAAKCHLTVVYADGRRESGIAVWDNLGKGPNEPLNVTWESDYSRQAREERERQAREAGERAYTAETSVCFKLLQEAGRSGSDPWDAIDLSNAANACFARADCRVRCGGDPKCIAHMC